MRRTGQGPARRAIRVANATADATQARLQQLSAAQRTRLCRKCRPETGPTAADKCCPDRTTRAVETVAETEARLDRDRERHRAQRRVQPQPSLLEQPAVRHKWVPSIDTYLNWMWCNVSLAARHFLACSYNLCSLLSVCDVIGLFLAQARPTDDYHLPSDIHRRWCPVSSHACLGMHVRALQKAI